MRLNLGCGPVQPDGWVNLDPDPQWGCQSLDLAVFPDGAVQGAVAHHVLQMVAWPDLVPWLTEVRRVLRPGGWLRLSVPDLELAAVWLDGQHHTLAPPISDDHEGSVDGKVCLWLSQAGATRSVFTGAWLVELCQRAGYNGSIVTAYRGRYGSAPGWLTELDDQPDRSDESVYVQARA